MNRIDARISKAIDKVFKPIYPSFPVLLSESPDDQSVVCVRVFAVPVDRVQEVKTTIRRIGSDLFPEGDHMLLPMVKNLEVTRQYYPEHLPAETPGYILDTFILDTRQYRYAEAVSYGLVLMDTYAMPPYGAFVASPPYSAMSEHKGEPSYSSNIEPRAADESLALALAA